MLQLYERLLDNKRPDFDTPADFLRSAVEYFAWATEHPIREEVVAVEAKTGRVSRTHKKLKKVFTKDGLFSYLNLPNSTFDTLRTRGPEWADAVDRVELIIRDDKFTGAVSGIYNANIISRDLGLAEKSELSGPNGGPVRTTTINVSKMSTEALTELMGAFDEPDSEAH